MKEQQSLKTIKKKVRGITKEKEWALTELKHEAREAVSRYCLDRKREINEQIFILNLALATPNGKGILTSPEITEETKDVMRELIAMEFLWAGVATDAESIISEAFKNEISALKEDK